MQELEKLRSAAAARSKEIESLEGQVKEKDAALLKAQGSLGSAQNDAESEKQKSAGALKALEADIKKAQAAEETVRVLLHGIVMLSLVEEEFGQDDLLVYVHTSK